MPKAQGYERSADRAAQDGDRGRTSQAPAAAGHSPARRTGRRPGDSGSRQAIVRAARIQFAEHGYDGATIRGIAREAKVDPALVHHFFTSKQGVFAAAMRDALNLTEVLQDVWEPGLEGAGERLVQAFLGLWEDRETRLPLLGIIRSAVTHEESAVLLRDFVAGEILESITQAGQHPEGQARAALIGSQLIGLAMMRYVVIINPLSVMAVDDLVRLIGPTIQRYLTSELDLRHVVNTS